MRTSIILTAILAAVLACCALPAGAAANSVSDRIYVDCEHSPTGYLTGKYTTAQLNTALHNLPGDVSEYSGCYDAIKQALLGGGHGPSGGDGTSGGGPAGGGGSGVTPNGGGAPASPSTGTSTPTTRHVGSKAPVTLAGTTIRPGVLPTIGRDASTLPTPLIVFLVLLGAGALALVALPIGRRLVARRHT